MLRTICAGASKLALARIGVGAPKLALATYPSRLRLEVKASFDAPAIGLCITSVNYQQHDIFPFTLRQGPPELIEGLRANGKISNSTALAIPRGVNTYSHHGSYAGPDVITLRIKG
ncbi:MAG: hypothetical protein NTX45_13975 [Proteobacteria bacterium]|nr:hypothetical protein [Pseudomonadota bacterium]